MHRNPRYTDLVDENGKAQFRVCTSLAHPNGVFYKCYWQIFHSGSGVEGPAFFDTPPLCTHDAHALMEELRRKGEGYSIFATSVPRSGKTPFDFSHPRWDGMTPAPAFEEDTDPEWNGHK